MGRKMAFTGRVLWKHTNSRPVGDAEFLRQLSKATICFVGIGYFDKNVHFAEAGSAAQIFSNALSLDLFLEFMKE